MKILIASDCYKPTINGVVTSIINLRTGLEAMGHEVRILTLSTTRKTHVEDGVYYLRSLNTGKFYPDSRLKLMDLGHEVRELLEWKPDIVHTQTEFSIFFVAKKISRKLSIPLVHTYHTAYEDYTHYISPSKRVGKKVVTSLTHLYAEHVSCMIAPTQKMEDMLRSYDITCPIYVVPSGIALSKFQKKAPQDEIARMKKRLGIPQDHVVLLSVSRVGKEKNIHELIDNMNSLKDEKITLLIVGDGPERKDLQHNVEESDMADRIIFTGMVAPSEIPKYYQIGNLFVSASTSETQGLTYIEALASGTPILCRQDECLDGVLEEGLNGYSFTNPEEFLTHLHTFLNRNDKESMIENAERIAEKFSIENFVNHIFSLYADFVELGDEYLFESPADEDSLCAF